MKIEIEWLDRERNVYNIKVDGKALGNGNVYSLVAEAGKPPMVTTFKKDADGEFLTHYVDGKLEVVTDEIELLDFIEQSKRDGTE